jgi:Domain of unknown function (DUF4145)
VQLPYAVEESTQEALSLMSLLQETALFLWKEWPRDMEAVALNQQDNFSLTGTCPHCNHLSVFIVVSSKYAELIQSTSSGQRFRLVAGLQCQGCKKYILGQVLHLQGQMHYDYEAHYPVGKPDDTVAEEIPEHIKPDFKEALRCLFVDAYNATAEMCRRALEASCIDLGAPSDKVLDKMIDWLADQRKITPFLKDAAHKIRLGGNKGAHPPEDGPLSLAPAIAAVADPDAPEAVGVIGKEHALAIVEFTRQFFHNVYVGPKQLGKYDFSKPKAIKP